MKAFETLEAIKVGTYIYNTASTGKENVIVVDAIEEKGGKKYAVGTRNGSPARFEIKVNEYFNYEYFVPMNKRGRVQNEVNIVWEHHRVKDEAEAENEEPKSGDVVEIDGKEYEVTAVENYGFFVKGRDYIVPFSDEYKIVGDAVTEETAPAEVNSDEIERKEEDRPRIRVSYWSDDTLTEVVQKTVVGHITFCDNKATFEEAGRLVVIPCRLLILIQALDR